LFVGVGAACAHACKNKTKEEFMRSNHVWMDGELVPFENATVHVLNPTLHYGTGMFEGIRCYDTPKGSAVFRLKDHLKRLIESIHIVGVVDYPYTATDLYGAVHQTIAANGFVECYIRPLVFMSGPLSLDLDDWKPVTTIAVWEWGAYLGQEAAEKGVRMMVSSFTRHHPNVMMTKAKVSGNYVNSTFAKTMAHRAGFNEAVMLDPQGYVAECTGENLFLVRKGALITPPRTSVLEGVTRDSIITLARDMGYPVYEEMIARDQLYTADEMFVCGTAAEVVPVQEVDFRCIGQGRRGPITQALQVAYHQVARGQGSRSPEWLDYVNETVMAV
jgi:branched-chain amino acid aminotransferase